MFSVTFCFPLPPPPGHLAWYQQAGRGWVRQKRNGNTLTLAENINVVLPRPVIIIEWQYITIVKSLLTFIHGVKLKYHSNLLWYGNLPWYWGNLPWYFNRRKCRYCSKLIWYLAIGTWPCIEILHLPEISCKGQTP
jgi:hypothetical protein